MATPTTIGIDNSLAGARAAWINAASLAVRRVALRNATFTVAAVWAELARKHGDWATTGTPTLAAMGAVMRQAVRDGWMEATGRYEQHGTARSHPKPVPVWRSLVDAPWRTA